MLCPNGSKHGTRLRINCDSYDTVEEIIAVEAATRERYSPGMGLMRPAQGLEAVAYMRLGMRPARNPR